MTVKTCLQTVQSGADQIPYSIIFKNPAGKNIFTAFDQVGPPPNPDGITVPDWNLHSDP